MRGKPYDCSLEEWQDYLLDEADHEIKRAKELGEYDAFCAEMAEAFRRL